MRLTEKEHSGIHLISQSLIMYHTYYQIGTILIYGYVKDTCVLLAHVYVNVGTSAPAASLYKLNSDVQWSHLINLDSGAALFSKTRWLYPSCLLAWYLKVKGICSYISSNFFCSSHSTYFHLFSWKSSYPVSFSLLKMWRVLGPVKQSICSPLLMRRKQQLFRVHWVL